MINIAVSSIQFLEFAEMWGAMLQNKKLNASNQWWDESLFNLIWMPTSIQ